MMWQIELSITAHSLAFQALHVDNTSKPFNATCTNANHASSCPMVLALQYVTTNLYTPIAAVCY